MSHLLLEQHSPIIVVVLAKKLLELVNAGLEGLPERVQEVVVLGLDGGLEFFDGIVDLGRGKGGGEGEGKVLLVTGQLRSGAGYTALCRLLPRRSGITRA